MSFKTHQIIIKRLLDISLSFIGLILSFPFLITIFFIATCNTKSIGIISQKRVGQYGKTFKLLKFKTMRDTNQPQNYITTVNDPRITELGKILRRTKLDELPQLWNVLIGEMSFVGPRPDVPGYADRLKEKDKIILQVKPGITGPASLAFKDEEELLANQANPKEYNDKIIWPQKVEINKFYILNYSLKKDLYYIIKTIF